MIKRIFRLLGTLEIPMIMKHIRKIGNVMSKRSNNIRIRTVVDYVSKSRILSLADIDLASEAFDRKFH